MNELTNWTDVLFRSTQTIATQLINVLPKLLTAVVVFLLGWLITRLISSLIKSILGAIKFDEFATKLHADDLLAKANVNSKPSELVSKFFYWMLMLFVIVMVSDTLGWHSVSSEISKLLAFLPKILIALVFFIVGTFIARVVRDFINGATASLGLSSGRIIGSIIFYFLLIIVTITSLDQAGIDTSIITSNVLLIFGSVMLAASISYGFASKELLSNILASFFSRHTFSVGQTIEVEAVKGEIIEMSSVAVILQTTANEKVVIPTQTLITNKVKIIG
ncbi:MAG: mechanosensitive ion channel domain-containing protein [Saprospiraceae bacterium]